LALQRSSLDCDIAVWARREEGAREARSFLEGCLVTHHLAEALENCDIAVLCMSPHAIESAGSLLQEYIPARAVITDAGSVKEKIVQSLEASFGSRFVGAHPMAGSDASGIQAARAGLFDGAVCIITPTKNSDPSALRLVRELWSAVGCSLREMNPAQHDRAIARVSHLPHAAAAALVRSAISDTPEILELAGSGYRDSTRIAGGPSKMWAEILLDNRSEVGNGIRDLQNQLEMLKIALERGDRHAVEAFLADARELRINRPLTK
jgi:prephenate dehydrogenase